MAPHPSIRPAIRLFPLLPSASCSCVLWSHLRGPILPSLSTAVRFLHNSRALASSSSSATAQVDKEDSIPILRTVFKREYPLPRTKIYEHTRPQPRAPVRTRPHSTPFLVSDDQAALDAMYAKLLGRGEEGVGILSEELRWQAITHLSFDHGRQPYNNKLAFLGRRILFLQANLHLVNQPRTRPKPRSKVEPVSDSPQHDPELAADPEPPSPNTVTSEFGTYLTPTPFDHEDYRNVDGATYDSVGQLVGDDRLWRVANMAGLPRVMRWKPRNPNDLIGSGQDTVAIECLSAIVGAIALARGGLEAGNFVKQRILSAVV